MKTIIFVTFALLVVPTFADNEILIGSGFEPVVATNRQGSSSTHDRVTIDYMYMPGLGSTARIRRRFSTSQGSGADPTTWTPNLDSSHLEGDLLHDGYTQTDPTMVADTSNGDFSHGWMNNTDEYADALRTDYTGSLSGVPTAHVSEQIHYDRPWLALSSSSLYMTYYTRDTGAGFFHRIVVGTRSGSNAVTWGSPNSWYTPPGSALPWPSAPIAVGKPATAADCVMGLVSQKLDSNHNDSANQYRLFRSTNSGTSWDSGYTIASNAGWDDHNRSMFDYHLCTNPGTTNGSVYVFYVTTIVYEGEEPYLPYPNGPAFGPGKYEVLWCRRSTDNGATWGSAKVVINGSTYSGAAYATFDNNDAGYFRIGRVWSCVDGLGNIHVVWFDNREGRYAAGSHHDYWRVNRSKSSDGLAWGINGAYTSEAVSQQASVGGYGLPKSTGFSTDNLPPGDALSCDADSDYLYVAWPDTRTFDPDDDSGTTQVYFRRFAL